MCDTPIDKKNTFLYQWLTDKNVVKQKMCLQMYRGDDLTGATTTRCIADFLH